MNFSIYFYFGVIAVFLVFARQSEADEIANLMTDNEIAKYVLSQKFQEDQQRIISNGTDDGSIAARAAMEAISQAAEKCLAAGASPKAVEIVLDGILAGTRLCFAGTRKVNAAIDIGVKLAKQDSNAAAAEIKRLITFITDLIYLAGAPIHQSQGAALSVVGNKARDKLEISISSIQHAGHSIFETMTTTQSMMVSAIQNGGEALEKGEKAARKVLATGADALYNHLTTAAHESFKGLEIASRKGSVLSNLFSRIPENLADALLIEVPKALKVVKELNAKLASILSILPSGITAEAVKSVIQGFVMTIRRTVNDVKIAKTALKEAAKLVDQNIEASTAAMLKGIQGAIDGAIRSSSDAYLGMGSAGHMIGKEAIENLMPAIVVYEKGRVASHVGLGTARRIASIGLNGGVVAAKQGLEAALLLASSAEDELYEHIGKAAKISLNVLKKLSKSIIQ